MTAINRLQYKQQESMASRSENSWGSLTLPDTGKLTKHHLVRMFHGDIAGIRIPRFLSAQQCQLVVNRIRAATESKARQYKGNLNIGTVLDIPSHWEFTYVMEDDAAWLNYFPKVGPTTRLRHKLFSGIGDPIDRLTGILQNAWEAPVRRIRHPKFGRRLYTGIIRSGAPKLHFDWAPFDLGLYDLVMQAGANIYLSNFQRGGDLAVYRTYGMTKGHSASSRHRIIGNYDLPRSLIKGVESHTITCEVGDFIIAPNRFLHEVTSGSSPENNRLVLSFHVGWMADGTLAIFS